MTSVGMRGAARHTGVLCVGRGVAPHRSVTAAIPSDRMRPRRSSRVAEKANHRQCRTRPAGTWALRCSTCRIVPSIARFRHGIAMCPSLFSMSVARVSAMSQCQYVPITTVCVVLLSLMSATVAYIGQATAARGSSRPMQDDALRSLLMLKMILDSRLTRGRLKFRSCDREALISSPLHPSLDSLGASLRHHSMPLHTIQSNLTDTRHVIGWRLGHCPLGVPYFVMVCNGVYMCAYLCVAGLWGQVVVPVWGVRSFAAALPGVAILDQQWPNDGGHWSATCRCPVMPGEGVIPGISWMPASG